jgi:hypothetical protein
MPSEMIVKQYFSNSYKDAIFTLWYSMGKPVARILYPKIPIYEDTGGKPAYETLHVWVTSEEFREKARMLDEQVMEQINAKMIAEKVEMLNRHATVGVTMQDIAMKYLDEHKTELGISPAVRLLVAGVEIERESRGIATTVEKITRMSDQDLESEIQKLLEKSPVELQTIDGEFDADNPVE